MADTRIAMTDVNTPDPIKRLLLRLVDEHGQSLVTTEALKYVSAAIKVELRIAYKDGYADGYSDGESGVAYYGG